MYSTNHRNMHSYLCTADSANGVVYVDTTNLIMQISRVLIKVIVVVVEFVYRQKEKHNN